MDGWLATQEVHGGLDFGGRCVGEFKVEVTAALQRTDDVGREEGWETRRWEVRAMGVTAMEVWVMELALGQKVSYKKGSVVDWIVVGAFGSLLGLAWSVLSMGLGCLVWTRNQNPNCSLGILSEQGEKKKWQPGQGSCQPALAKQASTQI